MRALISAFVIFLAVLAQPAVAEDGNLTFDNIYDHYHSSRGFGIAVHFIATDLSAGGLADLDPVVPELCGFIASELSAHIRAAGIEPTPNYLAVVIKTGGFVGRMRTDFFEYDDGGCGAELE